MSFKGLRIIVNWDCPDSNKAGPTCIHTGHELEFIPNWVDELTGIFCVAGGKRPKILLTPFHNKDNTRELQRPLENAAIKFPAFLCSRTKGNAQSALIQRH